MILLLIAEFCDRCEWGANQDWKFFPSHSLLGFLLGNAKEMKKKATRFFGLWFAMHFNTLDASFFFAPSVDYSQSISECKLA